MHKFYFFIPILVLLLLSITATSQYRVMNIRDLPLEYQGKVMPDVMGKVLVSEKWAREHLLNNTRDTVTVYPGWPVGKEGTAERGGVYGNLDYDPELEIIYAVGQHVYAFNFDGSPVAGWPVKVDLFPDGAPAYGDIDGDGFGEIVVTTHALGSWSEGMVYAFERNGTNVFGFPVETEGGAVRTPVLADLDDDGADEIIISVRDWPDGFVYVFNGDGTSFPGWPVRMNNVPATTAAVGDITGDGVPEIIAESYTSLHAYNTSGAVIDGFPFTPGNNRVFSHSSPVLADLDGDGLREIIFGDHNSTSGNGNLHVLKSDGTIFPGYPKETDFWIYSPPSIGDVDGNLTLDIIVTDYFHETSTPVNKVYGWEAASALDLPGYPLDSIYGVFSQVILADLNGDQNIDLMFDSNIGPEGFYYGLNNDGTPLEGWPLEVNGSSFTINPFTGDLNMDGILDISGGGFNLQDEKTYLYLWNSNTTYYADKAELPMLQYNTRHSGVYGDYLMVDIPEPSNNNHPGDIQIYPNPARDQVMVVCPPARRGCWQSGIVGFLEIYDIFGRKLEEVAMGSGQQQAQINVSGYPNGVYAVILRSSGQIIGRKKFVVGR